MGGTAAKFREVYTGQRVSGVPFRAFSRKRRSVDDTRTLY
jgi:hypothetical protein